MASVPCRCGHNWTVFLEVFNSRPGANSCITGTRSTSEMLAWRSSAALIWAFVSTTSGEQVAYIRMPPGSSANTAASISSACNLVSDGSCSGFFVHLDSGFLRRDPSPAQGASSKIAAKELSGASCPLLTSTGVLSGSASAEETSLDRFTCGS